MAQRLGEGAPCPPPFSRSSPPCPPPGSPPPVFPAWGRRRCVPRRPLVVPCPWSPPARAPPSLRRAGRGWGGRVCSPAFVLGAGRPPVASARLGTCGVAAGPRGVFRDRVCPSPGGDLRASAHVGCPPSAASRRQPWTVPPRSVGRPCRPCPPTPCLSLPTGPLPPGLGPGSGSSPSSASAPPLARPARLCPASRRSPLALCGERGLVRGCGEGRGGGRRSGVSRKREGSGPPRWLLGGRESEEGGVGWRWGPVAAPGGPGSVTGRQCRGSCPAGLAVAGIGVESVAACGPVPPPRLACPPHPVQVPSASRRGGLKTPWGVARPPRVGAVGPVGRSPFSPRLRRPPPPGAGVAAPRHGPCGRREGATRRPSCRACACAPCPRCVGVVGGNPLGACGVVRARPSRWGALAGCPVVQPFRPSLSLISFVSTGRPEAPSGECAVPDGGASPPGVGPLECQ